MKENAEQRTQNTEKIFAENALSTGYCFRGSKSLLIGFCLLFTVCWLLPAVAYAHKVNIYAYAEDGMVFSESYFVDGTKCKNSPVEVFDEKTGGKLLEGKTDKNGRFSFEIPKVTALKLVLRASMGHQNEYTVSEDEVREAMGSRPPFKLPTTLQDRAVLKAPEEERQKEPARPVLPDKVSIPARRGLLESELEAVVERVVSKKIQPMIRMLVKLQENSEKPGFTEIVGGIGYIIGLIGIVMYFRNRR